MELTGKIIQALEAQGGTSARTGNAWKKQEFVIETLEQYPRKMVFTVFGEDKLREMNIKIGETLTVSFDIDAHEWQGRWFNDIRAWRVQREGQQPAQQAQAAAPAPQPEPIPAPTEAPMEEDSDDLPF